MSSLKANCGLYYCVSMENLRGFREDIIAIIDSDDWSENWKRGDRVELAHVNAEIARRIKQS